MVMAQYVGYHSPFCYRSMGEFSVPRNSISNFLTRRFCAAHPHPEYGWVYSLTPHDGFKTHGNAYANILVTCEALGLNKCDLKSARKTATSRKAKMKKDLTKLPDFRSTTIRLMNKYTMDPTTSNKDEYLQAFNRYSGTCTSSNVPVQYITRDELHYPCATMTTSGVI